MPRLFDVRLHDESVGILREADTGFVEFRFHEGYLRAKGAPVLGQKFIDAPGKAYVGRERELPPFFANLVPEGELRPFLEHRLPITAGDDLTLIEAVGRDLPGAVTIVRDPDHLDRTDVVAVTSVGPHEPTATEEEFGFSLAGVQLKFSVVRAEDKIALPVRGNHGDSIVKLESSRFPGLVENEYSVLEWARRAGFVVPTCELVCTTALQGSLMKYADPEVFALIVRRYDRDGTTRVHQEDFAQMLNVRPRNKYGNFTYEALTSLVTTIVGTDGETGADEFIRRLVFIIACGNADAHLKNWSLVYPDRINPRLAPLYDQVATVAWPEVEKTLALKLAGVRNFADLTSDAFARLAIKARLDPTRVTALVDRTLHALETAWRATVAADSWKMRPTHTDALREHWRRTPILANSPFGLHCS